MWDELNARSLTVDEQGTKIYVGGSDGYARQSGAASEEIDIEVQSHDLIGGKTEYLNHQKTLNRLKYAIDTGSGSVTLEVYLDGVLMTWPDDTTSKTISGTGDAVQYQSMPPNAKAYKFSLRVTGSDLTTFTIYSPWEMEFEVTA